MKPARSPIRNLARRPLRPPRIFAVAALMAAPLVAVLATTPASAGTPVSVDLMTVGGASLRAAGNTWLVTAHYSGYTEALGSDIGFAVERILPGNKGQEFHSWAASAVGSTFTFNATSGKATLNSGKSLSPAASLNLTFSPTKKVMTACSFGTRETVYTGTLKGSVHIVTGTRPVSITLSSKAASFTKGGATTLTVDPCIGYSPCTGDSWAAPEKAASSGPAFGTVEAAGTGGYVGSRLHYDIAVTRMTQLSKVASFIRVCIGPEMEPGHLGIDGERLGNRDRLRCADRGPELLDAE